MYHIERLTAPNRLQLAEIIELYRAEGWWWKDEQHLDVAEKIVLGSYRFLTAISHDKIIGMARVISDGVSDAYIQDVAVIEKMRGHGIGSALVETLIGELKDAGISWIGLIAQGGSHPLYHRLGFAPMINAVPMIYLAGE